MSNSKALMSIKEKLDIFTPKLYGLGLGWYYMDDDNGKQVINDFTNYTNTTLKLIKKLMKKKKKNITFDDFVLIADNIATINDLQCVINSADRINEQLQDFKECYICFEEVLLESYIIILPCGHFICEKCNNSTLNNNCSICNREFKIYFGIINKFEPILVKDATEKDKIIIEQNKNIKCNLEMKKYGNDY